MLKNEIVAAVLVLVIIASGGAGYFIGIAGQRTITPSSSSATTTTSTMPSWVCVLSPGGSALYVKVTLDDGKTPAANATIDAVPVETCSPGDVIITILIQGIAVNASGVATLDASYLGYYKVTVHYAGQTYEFEADVHNSTPTRATCARLSVPSGRLSVTFC